MKLRVGVALLLVWLVPLWWLAPIVAKLVDPSGGAAVAAGATTAVVVLQSVLGLVGLALAGAAVKRSIKGKKLREAVPLLWHDLLHGKARAGGGTAPADRPGRPDR